MPQRDTLHTAIVSGNIGFAVADVRPNPKIAAADQIAIYRDGYILRLAAAVTADYPCLQSYLGAQRMTTLVQTYVQETPSYSYNLDYYPLGFASFVHDKIAAPAAALATLESAIAEVFILPASTALAATALVGCDDTTLGSMIFRPRNALRLLHLAHDADQYWRDHKKNCDNTMTALPIHLCICRDQHDVQRHRLAPPEYFLLQELIAGKKFNTAIATTVDQGVSTETELAQHIGGWMQRWFAAGYFAA